MKMKVKPTKELIADLKRLASAIESAKEASALKKRLASFRDDNADALAGDGVDLKVAWCESTGAQYVDTGVVAKPRIRVEAQLQWMVRGGDKCLIGARKDSGNYSCFSYHLVEFEAPPDGTIIIVR